MSSSEVKAGTTVRLNLVEGDLKVGRNATIKANSGGRVVVTGGTFFKGPVTIDGDLDCKSMSVEGRGFGPGGNVIIRGGLCVRGLADINASAKIDGDITSQDLDVGGHLESSSLTARSIRVGGHMTLRGSLNADSLDVGGHLKVHGGVELINMRVGGHAELGGGNITGEIKVRGHFRTFRKLNFGQFQAFGNLTLPAGSSGQRLSALGTVRFQGDASCKELDVGGTANVNGNCDAENIDVKGKLAVSGVLRLSKRLRVYGTAKAGEIAGCETLGVLGKLEADRAIATGQADIAGELNTRAGLKAQSVQVGKGSKVSGPLVAEEVEVGREMNLGAVWGLPWWRGAIGRVTSIQDAYGRVVRIGPNSSAKHVFGELVELQEGSTTYRVTYTKELKLSNKCYLHDPPVRTERLPEPPL